MDGYLEGANTSLSPTRNEALREAAEVFISMHRNFRVSRNLRAQWFFDHLGRAVSIQENQGEMDEYTREMTVVGIIPKGGLPDEFVGSESFQVSLDTKVTFLSRFYRQVFVLDLSPSSIVADEQTNSCLHHELLKCLQTSLSSVARSFTIPGTNKRFSPQFYVSIIVFVPFLSFSERLVLVHGDLLTESNIDDVLTKATDRFNRLVKSLHLFSQPVLKKWLTLRRHHRVKTGDSETNTRRSLNQETEDFLAMNAIDKSQIRKTKKSEALSLRSMENKNDMWYYEDQISLPNKQVEAMNNYIFPESAIIFILRLGLVTIQSLPEYTHSNIVVITDSVAGIPDSLALEELLNQIRNQTVSCSFIQVQGTAPSEACFGHVTSGELFHFLAMATFGAYIPNYYSLDLGSPRTSQEDNDTIFRKLNCFHRSLLCWSFQNPVEENVHITNLLKEISSGFAEFQESDSVLHRVFKGTYHSKLHELLYVRLREGFSMRKVEYLNDEHIIKIHLSMPFRPLVFIEYTITTAWPIQVHNRGAISAEVILRGPKSELKDYIESRRQGAVSSEERKKFISSLDNTIENIQQADELMMHIHSFNNDRAYYNLPSGIGSRAIFHYDDDTPVGQRDDKEDDFGKFLAFWKVLCNVNDGVWQKWVHMHFERVILRSRDLPQSVFSKTPVIDCGAAKDALYGLLKKTSSFCLLRDQLYVTFVKRNDNDVPNYFYMVRVSHEPPCLILKTAFPGGVNSCERKKVVEELQRMLIELQIPSTSSRSSETALTLFRRPLEKIIIRYGHVPSNLGEIVRLYPEEEDANDIITYNTISKYLYCKRRIWKLNPLRGFTREGLNVSPYILNLMLIKRKHEGFSVAWTKNGMVSLCHPIITSGGAALEQFIIFPPTLPTLNQRSGRLLGAPPRPRHEDKMSLRPRTIEPVVITTEAWMEPSVEYEKDGKREPAPIIDDDLVALLFTIDQLLWLCDSNVQSLRIGPNDGTDERQDEQVVDNRSISIVHQSVQLAKLAAKSNRVLIHVPTFETENDFCRRRLRTFYNTLNRELDSIFSVYIDIDDPQIFLKIYDGMIEELSKSNGETKKEHFPETTCRMFLKKVSHWSAFIVFVPHLHEDVRWPNCELPLIACVCDEAQLAYGLIKNLPLGFVKELDYRRDDQIPRDWEDHKPYDVPVNMVSSIRCSSSLRDDYTPVALQDVVECIYSTVVDRAVVSAVYACICRDIPVNPGIIQSVLDDQSRYGLFEVESVSSALETFCSHLSDTNKENDSYSCKESNLANLFNEALGKNFHEVPGLPNYFYFYPLKDDSGAETRRGSLRTDGNNPEDKENGDGPDDDNMSNVGSLRARSRADEIIKAAEDQSPDDYSDNTFNRKKGKKQETPLFVVFNCDLKFRDIVECFALSFIPSCINSLLKLSQKIPPNFDVREVSVKMLLYVFTWPSPKQFANNFLNESSGGEDGDELDSRRSDIFLQDLPQRERAAIRQLTDGMNRLLELESILIDSRKDRITLEKLRKIASFISTENEKECERMSQIWGRLSLVESSDEIKQSLLERLDGIKVKYCRLKRVDNSNYFYICQVENMDEFGECLPSAEKEIEPRIRCDSENGAHENEQVVVRKYSSGFTKYPPQRMFEIMKGFKATEGGNIYLKNLPDRKDLLADFWVILIVEDTITLLFCQRYKNQHTDICKATWAKFHQIVRTINQERLLAKMYELKECDSLLLCPDALPNQSTSSTDESDDELPLDSRVFETDRAVFRPGYFACQLQKLYWFDVHTRLRYDGNLLSRGCEIIRNEIGHMAVKNVPNTYVIREDNDNVMYMHIYTCPEQFKKDLNNNKLIVPKEKIREVEENIKSRILLAVYGINEPGDEINNILVNTIQSRLDEETLDVMINNFNNEEWYICFEQSDISFLQQSAQEPTAIFRLPIPGDMREFLEDLFYYTQQHLQIPMSVARFKENVNFAPYSNIALPADMSPSFFAYVKQPVEEKGVTKKGIACLEVRFVDSEGQLLPLTHGVLREHSHSLLVKTFNSDKDRHHFYKSLTCSSERQSFNTSMSSNMLMQVFVWERGDVGLEDLKQLLLRVLERACCDVVTEYGILNLKVIENSGGVGGSVSDILPQSPHGPSSYKSQLNISKASPVPTDKRQVLRKRDSSEALPNSVLPPTPTHILDSSRRTGSSIFSFESGRRGSIASEVGSSSDIILPPTKTHLNPKLVSSIVPFFDYVIAKEIENKSSMISVQSYSWEFDCQDTLRKALSEICDKLEESLKSFDDDLSDKVYFCERTPVPATGADRYNVKHWKIVPQFVKDQGVLLSEKVKTDYIILAMVEKVAQETLRYGYEITKTGPPPVLEKVANDVNTYNFFVPNFNPFVPRQRLLYGIANGERLTVYFYNYNPDKIRELLNFINRATLWHLARSRLTREISLHKLGLTHLSPVQSSIDNPYLCLVWRSTAKLIEIDYPPEELNAVAIEGLSEQIADLVLRPFRKADLPFVPSYCSQCLINNQLEQILSLRADLERRVHRFITLSQVHARLRNNETEIKESELTALLECSRRVHFVQTPVLLFPKWRRKIAEIRAIIEPKTPKKENVTRPPMPSSSSSSRRLRSSTLSVPSPTPQQPLRFKSEQEDTFEVKILYMLMNDYISYLTTTGLKLFKVTNLTEKSEKMSWYQTEYPQKCTYAPTVCLFKETSGGIVVVKLSFLQPYFILSIHVYSSNDLIQNNKNISDMEARSRWRKLEEVKDHILSRCHVHSFTYDFHLRILSRYLVGKDEVLFSNGYNTYSFLVAFLKYYGCRPPNARNCVYEERQSFDLNYGVLATNIWTHFLDMHYAKHYGWKVVRLKNTEEDSGSEATFMIVSSDKPRNLNGHEKLRVLLRDRYKEEVPGRLNLVQYLVLVDVTHISPMEDELHREEYNESDVGEFRHVEGPSEAEKEAEIDNMVESISQGRFPTVDGSVNRKRRFSSGGIEKSINQIKPSGSSVTDVELSFSPMRGTAKAESDSDMRLSVEGSASRRHRKTVDSDDFDIPGERVIYVQFLCAKQRNLQMVLEDAVAEYNRLLKTAVEEAEWKCRRDNIWSKVLQLPKKENQPSVLKSWLSSKIPQNEVWTYLRSHSHDIQATDLDTLLTLVQAIDMSSREERLIHLLQYTNCARLCRFLFSRYGADRCRFLEYPPSPTPKKCLLITNPNNLDTLFLVSCDSEITPTLSVLLKDNYLNDNVDEPDETKRYQQKELDQAFDELVQCVTASLWADLLQKPPGRA